MDLFDVHVLVLPSWKDPTGSFFRGETHSSWKVGSDWLDESKEKVKNEFIFFYHKFLQEVAAGDFLLVLRQGNCPLYTL